MSDPKRLLNADSDADALERALLESLHDAGSSARAPSPQQHAAIWQNVSAGMVAAGIVSASASVAASGSAVASGVASAGGGATAKLTLTSTIAAAAGSALPKALIVKLGLIALLSGAGVGAVALYRSQKPRVVTPALVKRGTASHAVSAQPKPAQPPLLAPSHAPATTREARVGKDEKPPARAKASAHAKPSAPDQLARESALLTEARAALRSGDSAGAQAALERLTRTFPQGVLVQEREVLEIELLIARDQNAQARARAARFVAQHPESPHSQKLERLSR